jgi:hypothetical protein
MGRDELDELRKLAAAAIVMHDRTTHFGACDVCDLVTKWRTSLPRGVDVDGYRGRKEVAK